MTKDILKSLRYLSMVSILIFGLVAIIGSGGEGDGEEGDTSSNGPQEASIYRAEGTSDASGNITFQDELTDTTITFKVISEANEPCSNISVIYFTDGAEYKSIFYDKNYRYLPQIAHGNFNSNMSGAALRNKSSVLLGATVILVGYVVGEIFYNVWESADNITYEEFSWENGLTVCANKTGLSNHLNILLSSFSFKNLIVKGVTSTVSYIVEKARVDSIKSKIIDQLFDGVDPDDAYLFKLYGSSDEEVFIFSNTGEECTPAEATWDTDWDLVNDDVDNCPNDSNTNQSDSDGDGIGNVCDDIIYDASGNWTIIDDDDDEYTLTIIQTGSTFEMQGMDDGIDDFDWSGTVNKDVYTYKLHYIDENTFDTTVWGSFTLISETTLEGADSSVVKNSDGQIIHEDDLCSWKGTKQ